MGLGEQGNMGHLNWPIKTENILENITKTILRLKNAVNQFGSNLRDQIGSHKMFGQLNLGNKGTQANFKRKQRSPPPSPHKSPILGGPSYHPFRLNNLGYPTSALRVEEAIDNLFPQKSVDIMAPYKKKIYLYIYIYISSKVNHHEEPDL